MKRDRHTIVDTDFGEVMVKSNGECYIGDNFDCYVGEINPRGNKVSQINKLFANE